MAEDIPIPFVDSEVDTSEPSSALMTVVTLVVGFGLFAMASDIGGKLAQRVNETLFTAVGVETEDGGSNGVDII